jgi:hypothetical protein
MNESNMMCSPSVVNGSSIVIASTSHQLVPSRLLFLINITTREDSSANGFRSIFISGRSSSSWTQLVYFVMHPSHSIHASDASQKQNELLYPSTHAQPHSITSHDLCGGLGGLLCLGAPQLLGGGGLDGLAGLADGGGAGNGVLAEVGAVVALGGGVDDGGVDPVFVSPDSSSPSVVFDGSPVDWWL